MRSSFCRWAVRTVAIVALIAGAAPAAASAAVDPPGLDFESASQASAGYQAGACNAPSWLAANDGPPRSPPTSTAKAPPASPSPSA